MSIAKGPVVVGINQRCPKIDPLGAGGDPHPIRSMNIAESAAFRPQNLPSLPTNPN
jgi:hypothetical protein